MKITTSTSPMLLACAAASLAPGLARGAPQDASDEEVKPIQVFILAGQSNMEGKAAVSTLDAVIDDPQTHDQFAHLKPDGQWLVRDDVWVTYLDRMDKGRPAPVHGRLTIGFGSPKTGRDEDNKKVPVETIGPELGIGHVLGDHLGEPVLLIKAAWGGRAVKYGFRPPSAMPTDQEIEQEVAAIRERKPSSDVTFASYEAGYGSDYRKILSETARVLDDLETYVPGHDAQRGYQLAGFIWFQGWNDGVGGGNPEYVDQMAHFIRDIREDLGVPELPFVLGELGTDGLEAAGWIATFRGQQAEIAALPEFQGTVRLARTAHCWDTGPHDMQGRWQAFRKLAKANEARASDDPERVDPGQFYQENWARRYARELAYTSDKRYHYNGSGRCYYEMGLSMGDAMVELLE